MATIAIFDSGVGGLSVYQEVVAHCPEHDFVFASDNQAFPYGLKTSEQLIERVCAVIAKLIQQTSPDLLVVACNTASTVALPVLRAHFDLPIVGVVPAIKPAAADSKSKVIGVLATPATIKSDYTRDLVEQFAFDCEVVKVGSSELVQMTEQKLRGVEPDMADLSAILKPFLARPKLDVLVLACTHFPLLNNQIKGVFKLNNHPLVLLDSGFAIAMRVNALMQAEPALSSTKPAQNRRAIFTQAIDNSLLINTLNALGFEDIDVLDVA